MSAVASPPPSIASPSRDLRRRVATAALLGILVVSLMLAVPGLRPVVREIRRMSPAWIAVAIALELASCLSFVVVFRLFFDRVDGHDARALAWTTMSSGALLPAGGVGGLAISGWLMSLTGAPSRWIIRRSSGLFFLTSAFNVAGVAGAGLILLAGGAGPNDFLRAGLPVLAAAAATLAVIALPHVRRRRSAPWLDELVAGIRDAERALLLPNWRLIGAVGYLAFDVAVLWATLTALGHSPSAAALMLGYSIGYLANMLPIPGGIGVLDGGLAGALLLYGAPPAHVAAAVLVYHSIALWLPGAGGLLAYARLSRRLVPNRAPERGPR
jgi:uncharacterized membrane protein YbhN (UPF0104 family)